MYQDWKNEIVAIRTRIKKEKSIITLRLFRHWDVKHQNAVPIFHMYKKTTLHIYFIVAYLKAPQQVTYLVSLP